MPPLFSQCSASRGGAHCRVPSCRTVVTIGLFSGSVLVVLCIDTFTLPSTLADGLVLPLVCFVCSSRCARAIAERWIVIRCVHGRDPSWILCAIETGKSVNLCTASVVIFSFLA